MTEVGGPEGPESVPGAGAAAGREAVAPAFGVTRGMAAPPAHVVLLMEELRQRGIRPVWCATGQDALRLLLDEIPRGAEVMTGTSVTVKTIGFERELLSGAYDFYRPRITAIDDGEERVRLRRRSTTAEYYVGGVNAISQTGEILNVDGSGSRVAGYAYGGGRVYLVAGINKIAPSLEAALTRMRNVAATAECRHLGRDTPCARDGICRNYECRAPARQCGKVLIIENEGIPGRITLLLVGEELGY
jgi:hypothetical protein